MWVALLPCDAIPLASSAPVPVPEPEPAVPGLASFILSLAPAAPLLVPEDKASGVVFSLGAFNFDDDDNEIAFGMFWPQVTLDSGARMGDS